MKKILGTVSVVAGLLGGACHAQDQAPVPMPALASNWQPGPAALPPDVAPHALLDASAKVIAVIDAARQATLWPQASTTMRTRWTATEFAGNVGKLRAALGAVQHRQWVGLNLLRATPGAAVPPGWYASCEFMTDLADGRSVRELVSIRLDEDSVWRLAGYSIR